ncbi:MAG: hypothetical protein ACR2QE_04020 [Acidimicrobiales bacterium]
MLRGSADANNTPIDLAAIKDESIDPAPGVAAGRQLRNLVDAIVLRDRDERSTALAELTAEVGEAGAVRAAAVTGNFEMMNRLMDGIGVGAAPELAPLAAEIGVTLSPV